MKFVGYIDQQKPHELVFLNLQGFDGISSARDSVQTGLLYSIKIGNAIMGGTTVVPVKPTRMHEIWNAADVTGDPTLSVSRVYPAGTNHVSRGQNYSLARSVERETREDLQLQASEIRRMTVSLDSRTENGEPMLTIERIGEKTPIYAIGDFSPLTPHLVMADPSSLQRMQTPSVAQIADGTPPYIRQNIRQIGEGTPQLGRKLRSLGPGG